MKTFQFWDLLPKHLDIDESVITALEKLETSGWIARTLYRDNAIRLWPENRRSSQFTLDLRYPLNEHKYRYLEKQTGVLFTDERKEHENQGS